MRLGRGVAQHQGKLLRLGRKVSQYQKCLLRLSREVSQHREGLLRLGRRILNIKKVSCVSAEGFTKSINSIKL